MVIEIGDLAGSRFRTHVEGLDVGSVTESASLGREGLATATGIRGIGIFDFESRFLQRVDEV